MVGQRTWTVLGEDYATVGPVEEWIEAHRHLWSPNTVRGYATSLAQWWSFLEQRGQTADWGDVGVPAVSAFLSWLRNGRTVEHSLAVPDQPPTPATLEARLAALISFYRWHQAVSGVAVAGQLLRGTARRRPARGLLAHLDGRSEPAASSLVRVRRSRNPDRPPVLLPQQIQEILDGCAVFDAAAGAWRGNLRDRFLFALLAETGMFSGGRTLCASVVL
jgi:integrase